MLRQPPLFLMLALAAIATSTIQAESLRLYWSSFVLFDRIVTQARDHPELKVEAFHFLRVVAEGRKDEISPKLVVSFPAAGNHFVPFELAEIGVRARAFEQIGRLATPEALAYLESVDVSKFSSLQDQPLAASIPLGIFFAKVGQIPDQLRRWEFLAETLRHPPEGLGRGGPLAMAYRGLCTEGALRFLPDVESYLRRESPRKVLSIKIQLCREMMHLTASHQDRAKGLGAALRMDDEPFTLLLRGWAIQELSEMHTKESRDVLGKFINDAKAQKGDALRLSRLGSDVRSAELALARQSP